MIMFLTAHRLYVLFGSGLIALGLFVVVHPELFRGSSLMLLGLAALERGSTWVRKLLGAISERLSIGGTNDGGGGGGRRVSYDLRRQRRIPPMMIRGGAPSRRRATSAADPAVVRRR